jgi:hypothetical protein
MAKPLLVGLLAATALVLLAVVVAIWIRAPSKTTVTSLAVPSDAVISTPAEPAGPSGVAPATTVVVGSGAGTVPSESPGPLEVLADEDGDEEDDANANANAKDKKGRRVPKVGYVSVKANGVKVARVFIDNKDVGYSPVINHKLKIGRHRIKVVEDQNGRPGKSQVLDILVGASNTRKEPLKLLVNVAP